MKVAALLVLGLLLALAGCGGSGSDDGGQEEQAGSATTREQAAEADAPSADQDGAGRTGTDSGKARDAGTRITVGDSEFGRMLFGSNEQAIYIFENDSPGETVCYGECAAAWPPVTTAGSPQAGRGVEQSLLGTVKRRNGKRQVTYDGQPLYFYANERPGEVRCHNVNLNGGFWWVVGPDGERRA